MLSLDSGDIALKSLKKDSIRVTPESPTEPLPRKFERFTLLNRVARGGMGEVYLATPGGIEGAERPLIVKIVRPDHADDSSFVARFLDEARIQSQLSHPGVAQILEATTDQTGKPYVVVEYVEGRNLSDVRTRAGQLGVRISWPEAVALSVCLGEALTHVHERTDPNGNPLEIVHRDLSPQNVMVGYGGEVKLIDFGTARGQNRRCQTVAGIVFAKPGYVAPEVANNEPGGIPADLYAFGVILWELLAGRRFLSGEAAQHMAAVGAGKRSLPPLSRIIGAPVEIDTLLARLTATSLEDRHRSARAALYDLVKLLQRAPSLADGDRSVRGRIADLMHRLYPAEPATSRADFARRIAQARALPPPLPLAPPASPEPPPSTDPSLLGGTRYRLIREIGRGGMGTVHEAVHLDLGRTVALKLLGDEAMSAAAQSRFRAEARAIAAIDHENLVKVYDFGACNDGRLFYAMELLHGESLDKRLSREGRLSRREVIELGVLACRALQAAHDAGVIHRDIKPANLFLTRAGVLKVLDFGVAKAGAEVSAALVASEEVHLLGTPEYMAPEQARGEAGVQSDVYALGAVLYELLTGSLPFQGPGALTILAEKSARPPARPSSLLGPGVGATLDRALMRALDPDPARRQNDTGELRRDLEAALVPAVARPQRVRRLGAAALALTVAGCLAVLIDVGATTPTGRAATQAATRQLWSRFEAIRERFSGDGRSSASPGQGGPQITAPAEVQLPAVVELPAARRTSTEVVAGAHREPEASEARIEVEQPNPGRSADPALSEASELTRQGKGLKALQLLRETAAGHADDPRVLAALTHALSKNGSWGEALRAARQRAGLDPSPDALWDLARLERATGHRERAVAVLEKLVQDEQTGAQAREMLRALTGSGRVAFRD